MRNPRLIVEAERSVAADTLAAAVATVVQTLRGAGEIATVESYLDGDATLLAADGQTALISVLGDGVATVAVLERVAPDLAGFRMTTVGDDSIDEEFTQLAEETLLRGELFGISLALVVLLLVFGAAVAAGLPIILAIVSIVVAVGATALVGQAIELSTFVVNIITMIGLAVGIDYSLFIVHRYREERDRGVPHVQAIERTGATASRAVFFSGLAVVIALSGMFLIPDTTFNSFGVGAIFVVLAAVVAALTLLPAVLSLLGDRVNWLTLPLVGRRRAPEAPGGMWDVIARAVTRRPTLTAGAVAIALLVLAGWYTTINLGSNGISALPADSEGRHAFEVLTAEFLDSPNEADIVVDAARIDAPAVQAAVAQLERLLAADPAFGPPAYRASDTGDLALIEVALPGDFSSLASRDALERLRQEYIPAAFTGVAAVYVTGDAAFDADYVSLIGAYTPLVFAYVLGFTFLLLLVTFRSLIVPIKAVVMNLLSVGAAYGLIVLVFQEGVGAGLLGFQRSEVIGAVAPALPLHGPVRPLHGLPRLLAQSDQGALGRDGR